MRSCGLTKFPASTGPDWRNKHMQTISSTVTAPNAINSPRSMILAGRILLAIFLLFMAMDILMHFANPPQAVAAFVHLGFPDGLSRVIAAISLVSVGLYL